MLALSELVAGKSVAVVGNSQAILQQQLAEQIDGNDVVVRINLGLPNTQMPGRPRIGRDAVGWRTDVWATARYWPGVLPQECLLILWMKLTRLGREELLTLRESHPHCPISEWPKELETKCRQFVGADPSTGIRLLWWLKTVIEHPRIATYGFDCWRSLTHWSGHRNTRNHDPDKEWMAMKKLGFA